MFTVNTCEVTSGLSTSIILPSSHGINEWPTTGRTVNISGREVPIAAVEASRKILQGEPATWIVKDYPNATFAKANNIIWIFDSRNIGKTGWLVPPCMVFLITSDRWIRLNEPQGLPFISHILRLDSEALNTSDSAFDNFMHDFSCLYQGYSGRALTRSYMDFRREFNAKEEGLAQLAGESIIVKDNIFQFKVNLETSQGGVDHWEAKGSIDDNRNLKFTEVTITSIKPPGTFSYDWMGDF